MDTQNSRKIKLIFKKQPYDGLVSVTLKVYKKLKVSKDDEDKPAILDVAFVKLSDDKKSFYFPEKFNEYNESDLFSIKATALLDFVDLELDKEIMTGLIELDKSIREQIVIIHNFVVTPVINIFEV